MEIRRLLELGSVEVLDESQRALLRKHEDWVRSGPPPPATDDMIIFERFTPMSGARQILSMRSDGTDVRNLSNNPSYVDGCPAWSPDRTKIVFARQASAGALSQL